MGFFGDAVGNLFIFFGENKELNGLPGTVDYVIQYKSDNKQSYKTKYHTSPVMKYHVAGTDDNEVASHNHASQRDILVFMDDGCNDVRTSRAAVAVEHDTQSGTAHCRTYQASHEVLSFAQQLGRDAVRTVHQQLEKTIRRK